MAWEVQTVPVQYVNIVWPKVEKFLADSVAYSDNELTLEEVKVYVVQGTWGLIVAVDEELNIHGAVTVHYFNRTDNRVAFVTNIGGKFIAKRDLFSQLSDILRENGATCIEGTVRDSLMRLWARLGARKKSTMIQIAL
jgi:hypothetical protein